MNSTINSIYNLETPALVVDLDRFNENLVSVEQLFKGTDKLLHPHVKTHRTPGLALMQLGTYAKGITCATVGEAEVMADAGITDILLANEIVTAGKIKRFIQLATRAKLSMAMDSAEVIPMLSSEAMDQGVIINILVDIDIGLGRCGIRDISTIAALVKIIDKSPGLSFAGIMGYEGRLRDTLQDRRGTANRALNKLREAKELIEKAGFIVRVVSAGGTSTLKDFVDSTFITEIQAGTYAFMEHDLDGLNLPFYLSAYVVATVVSRSQEVVVVDVGRKSLGCEYGPPIPLCDSLHTLSVNEEHTILKCKREVPFLGEHIKLRPSQIRTTFNLNDFVWLARGENIVKQLPVLARGKSQ